MSTRKALNKDLIMRRVSGRRHQAHIATSSTPPTTDAAAKVHLSPERCDLPPPLSCRLSQPLLLSSDVQSSSAVFSDGFARVESGLNHVRTVTHDHNARLAAISAADKEVEATRQLLRSQLTRRNALAPISILPPEILARVFHALALQEPPCDVKQRLGWIRTTHVCRHWRQVALDDSSLWARISGIGSDLDTALISEMLTRARRAPLEIDICIMNAIPNPMHMFAPHLSHTRALRLHGLKGSDSECASVRTIFNRKAPVLEHFELAFDVGHPITVQELGGKKSFKGQAPKLRSFRISQVCVPWSSIPRGQLTQLAIILRADLFEEIPSLGSGRQFIDLLVNCPALETLALDLCLPNDLSESSRGRTVHLPRLSRLCVGDSTSGVTDLLKMLKSASITALHMRCLSNMVSSFNDYHILPAISAQFQTSVLVEFKSLKVTLSHTGDLLDIAASASLHPSIAQSSGDSEADVDGEAEFLLSFGGLCQEVHARKILEWACKMLPVSNLEFLSIIAPDSASSVDWAELFKGCTNVTTIEATGRGTSNFVRALTPPNKKKGKRKKRDGSSSSAVPAPGPIIFPNLKSLLLQSLDFTENKSNSGIFYEVLANGLRQRTSTYNVPIKKVCVDRCVIPANRANALKRLVTDFRWDGEEGLDAFDEFEGFEDFDEDYDSDPGARWEDFFIGSSQAEWEWWENYSDGW